MTDNSQSLLQKKNDLVKQIEDNFLVVDKKKVQQITGISKRLMDYHLYHTPHHANNIDMLEKIIIAQLRLVNEKSSRLDELMETAKTVTQ